MKRMMDTEISKDELDSKSSGKSKLFKIFTDQKIEMLKNKICNIQVIVKKQPDNDNKKKDNKKKKKNHYEVSIIGKDMIEKLDASKKNLIFLESKKIKQGDEWINVYDEVLDNILHNRSQYQLIHKLLNFELSNGGNTNYIKNILMVDIIFRGGKNMETMKRNADWAYNAGRDMRHKSTESVSEKNIEYSLRSTVYKLTNSISAGNRVDFLNTIIRIYSSRNLPIPYVLKECYDSDEMFKAIGQGFILGLKCKEPRKETKIENPQEDK